MRVADVMHEGVYEIDAIASVQTAHQRMRQLQVRHLVVHDENNQLLGVILDTELRLILTYDPALGVNMTVADALHSNYVEVSPQVTVRELANLMRGRLADIALVMENRKVAGVVTTTDLLNLIGQGILHIPPEVEKRPVSREHPAKKKPGAPPSLGMD